MRENAIEKERINKVKALGFIRTTLCAALIFAMLLCSLTSCGGSGKTLMKLDKSKISINLFELELTRTKGMLCSTDYFGDSARSISFWETFIDIYDKKTYNTHYTELVLEKVKNNLAALAVYEEMGLTLPQSYIDEIDAKLEEMMLNDADGNKTAFNAILANYGANYDILRESYIIEAKIAHLREELFGKNGSLVGMTIIDEYYRENYVRFKQITLASYEFVYDEDENGDHIYYLKDSERISYDKEKTPKLNADGSNVTDKNGDFIYVYTDAEGKERIAYKTEGATRKQHFDVDDSPKIRYYKDSDPEMKILNSDANAILEEAKAGDSILFDTLVAQYEDGETLEKYPNGFYVSKNNSYEAIDVINEVFDMEIGDVRKVKSDYGIHIVMRYELEDAAYNNPENKEMFMSSKTETYTFMPELIDDLLYEYVKDYKNRIVVDEDLLKTVEIKNVGVNFYY